MKQVTVVIPTVDDVGTLGGPVTIKAVTTIGLPGPQGPGILSNISRITASVDPPANPEVNDLWIDLT